MTVQRNFMEDGWIFNEKVLRMDGWMDGGEMAVMIFGLRQ